MADLDLSSQTDSSSDACSKTITGDAMSQRSGSLDSAPSFEDFKFSLAHTIEVEIIPRLMSLHQDKTSADEIAGSACSIVAEELREFEQIILLGGVEEALTFAFSVSKRGVLIEKIILDLLAPTGKWLGERLDEEEIDFGAVSIALGRLQYVLHAISGTAVAAQCFRRPAYKVLLSAVPNDAHIFSLFGLLIVDQFFRSDGWDVWTMPDATVSELTDRVSQEVFTIVGLSISCESLIPKLRRLIRDIRAASLNKDLKIMVGGSLFSGRADYAFELGADATADNGSSAVIAARRLVEARPVYYRG